VSIINIILTDSSGISAANVSVPSRFGYDQGVFGGVVVTDDFLKTHNLGGDQHTQLLGTVTAIYDIGE
jgi:hypothetical protein